MESARRWTAYAEKIPITISKEFFFKAFKYIECL